MRAPDGSLRLLLLDKGRRTLRVRLPWPSRPGAAVARLSAPGPAARSGATLGGQWLDSGGRWRGAARTEHPQLLPSGRTELTLPPASGALITVG